ncbi:MAG: isochorismate synthase [Actinomycetia bacterium]|nr:isochorismate synthase [Actinomycetes bacterium]
MKSRTVRLDLDLDLVALGARSGLLWSRANANDPVPTLAGVGHAVTIPVERPGGAAEAQASLARLEGPNEVGGPGTGPVAFGAFPFDRTGGGELIVPEITLGRGGDGRRWLTIVDDGSLSTADAIDRISGVAGPAGAGRAGGVGGGGAQPTRFELRSVLAPELWRDEVVAGVRERIRSGQLDKAVVARELRLVTDHPVDAALIVDQLAGTFPAAILFLVEGFVGASPELLVSRNGDVVRAHPLAGTAPRASDPATDRRLAAELLASSKDRWEHQITIDWLLDGLLPFCSYVDAEPEPSIVSLANVHHLGTLVEGRLSSPSASALELVAALHPTPAVGGDPQAVALSVIDELEQAERGLYAGPVGWVDGEGNGGFAVGIRSAQISGCEARLFAGVGVVGESDPESELAETRSKFRAMLGALIRP